MKDPSCKLDWIVLFICSYFGIFIYSFISYYIVEPEAVCTCASLPPHGPAARAPTRESSPEPQDSYPWPCTAQTLDAIFVPRNIVHDAIPSCAHPPYFYHTINQSIIIIARARVGMASTQKYIHSKQRLVLSSDQVL